MRLHWTRAIVGDLVALQAVQSKVSMMPHPTGDVDAWIKLPGELEAACEACSYSCGSPALEVRETVRCLDCHKEFLIKGLGAHRARVRGVFRVARTVVDRSGICPVCGLFFHTRQRVIHHIEHSCERCSKAV